jgi:tRNA threonylcarbamoyladenosine biosynthesis protein TsaB
MILALDTSGEELVACVLEADMRLREGVVVPGRRHQDHVLQVVERLLGGTAGAGGVTAVAVVRGPGSQTGLRVGLSTAEGLAFGRRLRLVPLSSLAVAAHRADLEGPLLAAVSAGRSNLYVQAFTAAGATRRASGERWTATVDEVARGEGVGGELALAAEPAVLAAVGTTERRVAPPRGGVEALAAAAAEALGAGASVAYDQLQGDY